MELTYSHPYEHLIGVRTKKNLVGVELREPFLF